ncbi:MAG: hypothetical protein ABIM50_04330 [Novosphingobium sp.]
MSDIARPYAADAAWEAHTEYPPLTGRRAVITGDTTGNPEFQPDKQRELIKAHRMLRAEDIAVAALFMLRQPRRCAVSDMRVETRLDHP